jgi:hypothetical protein
MSGCGELRHSRAPERHSIPTGLARRTVFFWGQQLTCAELPIENTTARLVRVLQAGSAEPP